MLGKMLYHDMKFGDNKFDKYTSDTNFNYSIEEVVEGFNETLEEEDPTGEFWLQFIDFVGDEKKVHTYIKPQFQRPRKLFIDKSVISYPLKYIDIEILLSLMEENTSIEKFKNIVDSRFAGNYEEIYKLTIASGDVFCLNFLSHFRVLYSIETCINIVKMLVVEHPSSLKRFFIYEEDYEGDKVIEIFKLFSEKSRKETKDLDKIFDCVLESGVFDTYQNRKKEKDKTCNFIERFNFIYEGREKRLAQKFKYPLMLFRHPFKNIILKVRYYCDSKNPHAIKNPQRDIKFMIKYLAKIDKIKRLLKYSEKKAIAGVLEIFIDYNHKNVSWMLPGRNELSWTPFDKSEKTKIYIGRCANKYQRYSVFARELFHFVCLKIYDNEGAPYAQDDKERRKEYDKVIEETSKKSKEKLIPELVIDLVFNQTNDCDNSKRELLANVPHLYSLYFNSQKRLEIIKAHYKELFDFYEKFEEDLANF